VPLWGDVFSWAKNHPQSAPALPQGMAGVVVFDKKTQGRIEDATQCGRYGTCGSLEFRTCSHRSRVT
jgi:hypothetical protein